MLRAMSTARRHDLPYLHYFAYGSNLHPLRLARRLAAPRLVGTARLEGWVIDFDKRGRDGSGKCRIAAGDGCVHGAVYALTCADLARLDAIEGVGAGYERIELELPGLGPAATYVAMSGWTGVGLEPYDWYLSIVLAGADFHRLPTAYRAALAARPTRADPDPARAAAHAALLEELRAHPA
jgi:gamma-glutamylcyclotransferase